MGPRISDAVRRRPLLALAAVGLAIYVPFLGNRDMWYPNEPDMAQVCQRMLLSGDFIAPRLNGTIFVDYPPLLYWAGAASARLFGFSEFALRLPNALAAIGTALLTAAVGARWFGPPVGLWAGFLLLTFNQFHFQAVGYRPDVLFTLGIAAGTLAYAAGCGARPRLSLRIAGFALFGVALLAKGPLGLLLPGLVLTLWQARKRAWRRVFELVPLSLVALAVYLPWFVACSRTMGADSILHELYAQNVARFFGGDRGHVQPPYYFLQAIWLDLFPWSFALPVAVAWLWRTELARRDEVRLLACWAATWFVFLSVAVTKRQLYLIPAYPALALLIAPWMATVVRHARPAGAPPPRPARIAAGVVVVVWLGLAALALVVAAAPELWIAPFDLNPLEQSILPGLRLPLTLGGGVALAAATWVGLAVWRRDERAGWLRIGAANLALTAVILGAIFPALDPVRSYRPQAERLRDRVGAATRFGFVNTEKGRRKVGAFVLYTGGVLGQLMTRREEIERFFEAHPKSVVLVHDESWAAVFGEQGAAWEPRIEREFWVTRDRYFVVGPRPGSGS